MTRMTPGMAPPVEIFTPHQREGILPPAYDLGWNRPTYTVDIRWNQVSGLVSSGPEAGFLPLGHRAPHNLQHCDSWNNFKMAVVFGCST
ncbi:hypothetical protein AVEN_187775-1 [Araneus ventricosus]|uniref:Uncharacterized protein n=1 Tax=Araneus ventricosus TaxID=182803 RepID=A0A4Y2C1X1_ARAVE|nr:hypothetical protein AVEN_187775-1 [Araneus ventricosus]